MSPSRRSARSLWLELALLVILIGALYLALVSGVAAEFGRWIGQWMEQQIVRPTP